MTREWARANGYASPLESLMWIIAALRKPEHSYPNCKCGGIHECSKA